MSRLKELLKMNGVESEKKKDTTPIEISREDFDLLDVEEDRIYHIYETDGTITFKKGVNR